MTLSLNTIWDLSQHFVPAVTADRRLYECGPTSWWPAHEIGHFLVATAAECRAPLFGIDEVSSPGEESYRYIIAKEIAAISISQRLLRRSGHKNLADEEIEYTDEITLECAFERWCKRRVHKLLRENKVMRLPTNAFGMKQLLERKANETNGCK